MPSERAAYAEMNTDRIVDLEACVAALGAENERLRKACTRAFNTIEAVRAGVVRGPAAYITMVEGTKAQIKSALEGE